MRITHGNTNYPCAHCGRIGGLAIHPSLSACAAFYSDKISSTGRPPTRSDLDPAIFGRHLDSVMLLEYHSPRSGQIGRDAPHSRTRVRLAGSKLNAVMQQELRGAYLDDVLATTDDPYLSSERMPPIPPNAPSLSAHNFRLRDERVGNHDRLALPLAPIPAEPPMALLIFLDMAVGIEGGRRRSLGQVRGPLWVDRY